MIESGWVDVELRENKLLGGFCVLFFSEKELWIFICYDGSINSVRVFVYELGYVWYFYNMSFE